ncbi:MAG: type II secretion system protein [Candidatus Omnitrophota bacterium]
MKRGFTLIELLIVIAILGILVALVLPRFADIRLDANTKVCTGNLRGLANAMATYETQKNFQFPWGDAAQNLTAAGLQSWDYLAQEPYCPYELSKAAGSRVSYTLVEDTPGTPDKAECPNDDPTGSYSDHVWP